MRGRPRLLSTANLQKVLDTLAERATWEAAMKSIGGSESLAFFWRSEAVKAMKANDLSSVYWMEWRKDSGVFDWWPNHADRARREHLIKTEALIRGQAAEGVEELVFDSTMQPVWKKAAKYLHRSDDFIREAEGLLDFEDVEWYRYEHTPDGEPVQLTRRVQVARQFGARY